MASHHWHPVKDRLAAVSCTPGTAVKGDDPLDCELVVAKGWVQADPDEGVAEIE